MAYYEIKRGLLAVNATAKMRDFDMLCSEFDIGEMGIDIWEAAARIYAYRLNNGLSIDDADIFIASFCIVNGYTLVTHNTKHFEGIQGLKTEDWAV